MALAPFRQILCPVDASDPSAEASVQAIDFARWSGAAITALYVSPVGLSAPDPLLPVAAPPREETEDAMHRWMEERFQSASDAGTSVTSLVSRGSPAAEIVDCAARLPADLIVIGTHGTSGLSHLLLGSVTEKVLRQASCPVLSVPPRAVATSRLPFSRVLCAMDFSECSLAALEYAMTTSLGAGAALTLLHVLDWPWEEPPAPDFSELPHTEAAALLAYRERRERHALDRLDALRPEGLRERCHVRVAHGRPYVELLRVAAEEKADLIVLGVHGRNVVDMALFGSTSNQTVRRATCPVLTIRR